MGSNLSKGTHPKVFGFICPKVVTKEALYDIQTIWINFSPNRAELLNTSHAGFNNFFLWKGNMSHVRIPTCWECDWTSPFVSFQGEISFLITFYFFFIHCWLLCLIRARNGLISWSLCEHNILVRSREVKPDISHQEEFQGVQGVTRQSFFFFKLFFIELLETKKIQHR